jgi:hypothetical protein
MSEPAPAAAFSVPVAGLVHAPAGPTGGKVVRRSPADFGTSTAVGLKSGWGLLAIGSTPWDAVLKALRAYAALRDDQYAERAATLDRLPALLAAWELHHGTAHKTDAELNQDEKR